MQRNVTPFLVVVHSATPCDAISSFVTISILVYIVQLRVTPFRVVSVVIVLFVKYTMQRHVMSFRVASERIHTYNLHYFVL